MSDFGKLWHTMSFRRPPWRLSLVAAWQPLLAAAFVSRPAGAPSLRHAARAARASASLVALPQPSDNYVDWDYRDAGTASWRNCQAGSQSPINVSETVASKPPDSDHLFYHYMPYETPVTMLNDGRLLVATLKTPQQGSVGGIALGQFFPDALTASYEPFKILIHTPSEHTFGGVKLPLEVQLFHRTPSRGDDDPTVDPQATELAVVAVGFTVAANGGSFFLEALRQGGLPTVRDGTALVNRESPGSLEFAELFRSASGRDADKAGFWEYSGSLTTPPCTTGVRWFVRNDPLPASADAVEEFTRAAAAVVSVRQEVPGNARALQPLNGRPVYPRFAEDVITSVAKRPPSTRFQSFDNAILRAQADQALFVRKAPPQGPSPDQAAPVPPVQDAAQAAEQKVEQCALELGQAKAKLQTARLMQARTCGQLQGGVPPDPSAAAWQAVSRRSCDDYTKVVSALEHQIALDSNRCAGLRAPGPPPPPGPPDTWIR